MSELDWLKKCNGLRLERKYLARASTTALRKEASKRGISGAYRLSKPAALAKLKDDFGLQTARSAAAKKLLDVNASLKIAARGGHHRMALRGAHMNLSDILKLDLDAPTRAKVRKALEELSPFLSAARRPSRLSKSADQDMAAGLDRARRALIGR